MRKLVLASMLAAFAAAITLPVIVADTAVAAQKGKSKVKSEKKKKPTQGM